MKPLKQLLAAALLPCAALSAQASVVMEDDNLASWGAASLILRMGDCPAYRQEARTSGGNTGAFLQFTQQACNHIVVGNYSLLTWDPGTQGALSSMTVSFDAQWISGSFMGDTRIGLNALLRQDGIDYFAMYNEVSTANWSHFGASLQAADWCRLDGCNGDHPDFSSRGSFMQFGIATSNNCPSCMKTLTGGLDNYRLELNLQESATVPEPAPAALVALGLALLLPATRRRR